MELHMNPSNEEIAHKLVDIYFRAIALPREKRSMELDDVLKAYQHTLKRLEKETVSQSMPSSHSATLEMIAKEVKGE